MSESLDRATIESAVHQTFRDEGVDTGDPFYVIRTVSPSTNTVIIGRSCNSTANIGDLLRLCGTLQVMKDPEALYSAIIGVATQLDQEGYETRGQLPDLWREVFEAQLHQAKTQSDLFPSNFTNGNLDTLTDEMERFVKHGIGKAFERVRAVAAVDGQEIAIIQRCPIHNFVRTAWLPAYIDVRQRLLQEQPQLVPSETVNLSA